SPGRIDSPLSREGAFLANNVVFAAFAFVVLLGTVYPLVYEALKDEPLSVGRPYFDRMTTPLALTLLFLMAVAPALPWRKASGEVLRDRLQWPAWAGAGAIVLAVAVGARGLAPLVAFGLGGFAAGGALRPLFLAVRAARRAGRPALAGVVGRSNGGMVVHLGVVVVAVAVAASSAYANSRTATLEEGESTTVAGHTVTYLGTTSEADDRKTTIRADLEVDGEHRAPALHEFRNATQAIGTPSVRWGVAEDVYLTLRAPPEGGAGAATVGVLVLPLASWLWIGGGIIALGTVLSLLPGPRRRRPTAEVPVEATAPVDEPVVPRADPAPVG
ncbi:MAG: ccmF, partial [Acidimicrobiales bacterium]|nr:ccmF [Acidimicrobiales bacterium]